MSEETGGKLPVNRLPGYIGSTLLARYDNETLRPEPSAEFALPSGPPGEAQMQVRRRLFDWCFAGAGTGRSTAGRPWALPEVEVPLSIAVLTGSDGAGQLQVAESLCRELDGSTLLEACEGRAAKLRLRLGVKFRECLWWRPRRASDPWDSGYLREEAVVRGRVARFLPRRATLVVADNLPSDTLRSAAEALDARRSNFCHPVRLLIIGPLLPEMLGISREVDGHLSTAQKAGRGDVLVVDLSE